MLSYVYESAGGAGDGLPVLSYVCDASAGGGGDWTHASSADQVEYGHTGLAEKCVWMRCRLQSVRALALSNMAVMEDARETSHRDRSASKRCVPLNIAKNVSARLVFHCERLWLNDRALRNMRENTSTRDTSHSPTSASKAWVPLNMSRMVITREVSQRLRSSSKLSAPSKRLSIDVTCETSQ